MHAAFAIGRVIVGLYYLFSGVSGFFNLSALIGFTASKGVPAPAAAVVVSHVLLIVAAICILTGWKPALGVAMLVVFFVPVTLKMHAFWADEDPRAKMNDMIHFMKNFALLGSALMFLGIPEPWSWSRRPAAAPAAPPPRSAA